MSQQQMANQGCTGQKTEKLLMSVNSLAQTAGNMIYTFNAKPRE